MSKKKKLLIGGAVGILTVGLVFGGIKAYEYYQAKELVLTYEDITFPNIKVNENPLHSSFMLTKKSQRLKWFQQGTLK